MSPINAILRHFTGIESLRAFLPWQAALVLVAISVALTLIAGIIPSRSAAKKDPVRCSEKRIKNTRRFQKSAGISYRS